MKPCLQPTPLTPSSTALKKGASAASPQAHSLKPSGGETQLSWETQMQVMMHHIMHQMPLQPSMHAAICCMHSACTLSIESSCTIADLLPEAGLHGPHLPTRTPDSASGSGQNSMHKFMASPEQAGCAISSLCMFFYTSGTPFGCISNVDLLACFGVLGVIGWAIQIYGGNVAKTEGKGALAQ